MRSCGNQLDDVRVWNRHRRHVRLHVGNPIRTDAGIRLPYMIEPRRSQFQDRAAGQNLRFGKKRPRRLSGGRCSGSQREGRGRRRNLEACGGAVFGRAKPRVAQACGQGNCQRAKKNVKASPIRLIHRGPRNIVAHPSPPCPFRVKTLNVMGDCTQRILAQDGANRAVAHAALRPY